MSAKVTDAREFAARKLAVARMVKAGDAAHAKQAHRLAARLYREGASVDRAAREASAIVAHPSNPPGGAA